MNNPLARDLDAILSATADLWEDVRGSNILITGATGFFGSWILESFVWANEALRLESRATIITRNPAGFRKKLPHLAGAAIDIVEGDVRSFEFPKGSFSHAIHAATDASADLNAREPQLVFDTIVEGTRHCLEFAEASGAGKLLFTSSGAVYGKQPPHLSHIPEDFSGGPDPLDSLSSYAEGKRAAELLCALAARRTGLQVKIARCFAFVGPYMKLDAHFAIGNFIRDYLAGDAIRVQGDGTPLRSYMYASDLMIWLWTILFRGRSCRAYNVGSEEAVSIAQLAQEVASIHYETPGPSKGCSRRAAIPVEIAQKPVPGAAALRYVPSTQRARQELGLSCSVSLRDAIERTIAWNKKHATTHLPVDAAGVSRW